MIDYTTLSEEEFLTVRATVEEESEQLRQRKLAIKAEVLRREAGASVNDLLKKLTTEEKAVLQALAQGVGLDSATSEAVAPQTD
ncbi:MAG: hypothetical protein JNJ94_12650 [Chlorobi bacterium]|nr:hypothetical protein [Chlorobiota bacterium]